MASSGIWSGRKKPCCVSRFSAVNRTLVSDLAQFAIPNLPEYESFPGTCICIEVRRNWHCQTPKLYLHEQLLQPPEFCSQHPAFGNNWTGSGLPYVRRALKFELFRCLFSRPPPSEGIPFRGLLNRLQNLEQWNAIRNCQCESLNAPTCLRAYLFPVNLYSNQCSECIY